MSDLPSGPSLFIRLAAMFYDALLLFSLLFAVTLFLVLPLTHGHAIHSGNPVYQAFLLVLMYFYFTWQWTHGGQTLGMRAWKIRVLGKDRSPCNWYQASMRFLLAIVSTMCFGLGFIVALFDSNRQTWHDRYSHTCLVRCD